MDDEGKSIPCESERERSQNPFSAFELVYTIDKKTPEDR